jgi:hypothetical protein
MGRPRMKPQTQLKKVMVVSQDLREVALMAMIPVITQCQMHSCKQNENSNNSKQEATCWLTTCLVTKPTGHDPEPFPSLKPIYLRLLSLLHLTSDYFQKDPTQKCCILFLPVPYPSHMPWISQNTEALLGMS